MNDKSRSKLPRLPEISRNRAFYYSALLHTILIVVVVIGIDWKSTSVMAPAAAPNVMQATAVDATRVAAEVQKLKALEQQKVATEKQRQADAESRVKEEELKLAQLKQDQAETKRQKALENRQLEAEKQRLEVEKEQAALGKRKAESEKKQIEEEARRALEQQKKQEVEAKAVAQAKAKAEEKALEDQKKRETEEARKKADDKKRLAAEKRKQEAAAAEAALKDALADEEAEQTSALQASQDATELQRYMARIQSAIGNGFVYPPGLTRGLKCMLFVRVIPGGEVVEARVVQSSGNSVFDRQAETAVRKASPLPVPAEARLMQQMREFNFVFDPEF